jgi:hypothetical protein
MRAYDFPLVIGFAIGIFGAYAINFFLFSTRVIVIRSKKKLVESGSGSGQGVEIE